VVGHEVALPALAHARFGADGYGGAHLRRVAALAGALVVGKLVTVSAGGADRGLARRAAAMRRPFIGGCRASAAWRIRIATGSTTSCRSRLSSAGRARLLGRVWDC